MLIRMDFVEKLFHRYVSMRKIDLFFFFQLIRNSFCSDVAIVTRHASASIGTKLVFDGEGQLISRVPCPREVGTTVSIRLLFNRFPVRRTELKTHSKREFSHALNIIQSFAIISRQIQHFQVSSSADNHPPTSALLTLTPVNSMKDTLAQIFGQKILQSIIHIDDNDEEDEDETRQFKVNIKEIINEKLFFVFSSMVISLDLNMVLVVQLVIDNISMLIIDLLIVHHYYEQSMISIDILIPINILSLF